MLSPNVFYKDVAPPALRQRRACDAVAQRFAFRQFRNDVRRAFMRADVIDDQNVGMIECARLGLLVQIAADALRFLTASPAGP